MRSKNKSLKWKIKKQMKMKRIKNRREEETEMKNLSINRRDLRQSIDLKLKQNLNKLKLNQKPNNRKNLFKRIKNKSKNKSKIKNNQNRNLKKRKNIIAIKVKKSKILNLMSQNKRMRNKNVITRKWSKRKTSKNKKRILRRKTKILRNKIKKNTKNKCLVIASVKAAITVTIECSLKKSTCIPNLSLMCAEVAVYSMITGLIIIRSILSLKSSITSRDSMIIIPDSNTVMMTSMPLINLFIIGEEGARSIIMIGHSILSHIKCILHLWEGFKVRNIIKNSLSKFLMDKGAIINKMIDNPDSSKVKMK